MFGLGLLPEFSAWFSSGSFSSVSLLMFSFFRMFLYHSPDRRTMYHGYSAVFSVVAPLSHVYADTFRHVMSTLMMGRNYMALSEKHSKC